MSDQDGVPRLPQAAEDGKPVQPGQHYIQEDHIVNTGEGLVQARLPVVAGVGGIALDLQQILEGVRQANLVLYN